MTDTHEIELLPCPFCGPGESVVDAWQDDYGYWRVSCGRCGSSSGTVPGKPTEANLRRWPNPKKAAIAAWNRRVPDQSQSDTIERLERENKRLAETIEDHMLPWSEDGGSVFIDGAGLVEIDHGGKLRSRAEAAERQLAEMRLKWVEADEGEKVQKQFLAHMDARCDALEAQLAEALEALKTARHQIIILGGEPLEVDGELVTDTIQSAVIDTIDAVLSQHEANHG